MSTINGYRWVNFTQSSGNYYITVNILVACLIFPGREAGTPSRLKREINKKNKRIKRTKYGIV